MLHQEKYGIPASIKMAQGLLESDGGNSRLAREANNHFGIKCRNDWNGETIAHTDDAPDECFRKYESAEASFLDHSEFLDNSPRYQSLFDLEPDDYVGWAHGLRRAGYATNPVYAETLIKLIEDYELFLLDRGQLPDRELLAREEESLFSTPVAIIEVDPAMRVDVDNYIVTEKTIGGYVVGINNGIEFISARPGDTFESLSSALGIPVKRLRRYNDADNFQQPHSGEHIYLKAKARNASGSALLHTVARGENLRSVSQLYGIRLNRLASINRLRPTTTLDEGMLLRLR